MNDDQCISRFQIVQEICQDVAPMKLAMILTRIAALQGSNFTFILKLTANKIITADNMH